MKEQIKENTKMTQLMNDDTENKIEATEKKQH